MLCTTKKLAPRHHMRPGSARFHHRPATILRLGVPGVDIELMFQIGGRKKLAGRPPLLTVLPRSLTHRAGDEGFDLAFPRLPGPAGGPDTRRAFPRRLNVQA